MSKTVHILLAGLVIVGLSQTALAVLVVDSDTGTVLLMDDFESPWLPEIGDSDPDNGYLPGTWSTTETLSSSWPAAIQVLDYADAPWCPSNGFQSDNWLKLYKPLNDYFTVDPTFANGSIVNATTNSVHSEWMTYIPSTQPDTPSSNYICVFSLNNSTSPGGWGAERTWVAAMTTGDIYYHDGAYWWDTGLDWTADTWEKWEVDFTQDPDHAAPFDGTYDLTVGGSTAADLNQMNNDSNVISGWTCKMESMNVVVNIDSTKLAAMAGDLDSDADVDLADYAIFMQVFTGPLGP